MTSPTLLAHLEALARADGGARFLADGPGKEGWCGAPPRAFTRAETLAAADNLAARWRRLGLVPGDGIGLALPAVAEAYVAVLACAAGGFVPVLLPLHLDEEALTGRVRRLMPAALVTCARVADLAPADALAAVAAGAFSVRHVMAFGPAGRPGVLGLDASLARPPAPGEARHAGAPEPIRGASREAGTLSLDADGRDLLAAGRRLARAVGARDGDAVIGTPLPSSLEGLAATLGLALAAGGQLIALGLPRLQDLRASLARARRSHLVLPLEATRTCAAAGLGGSASTVLLARRGEAAAGLARRMPGTGTIAVLGPWEDGAEVRTERTAGTVGAVAAAA